MKQVILTITASVAVVTFGYVVIIGLIILTKVQYEQRIQKAENLEENVKNYGC